MQWEGDRESENVEDARGNSKAGLMVGGGIGTLIIVLLGAFFGVDARGLLQQVQQQNPQAQQQPGGAPVEETEEEKRTVRFVKTVLAKTEDVWEAEFRKMGKTYVKPKLQLFRRGTVTACGQATSAVGPFYCPGDQKVYLDLEFFDELARKYKAPGEFAQAYVIAHEIGHHIQKLTGVMDKVHGEQARPGTSKAEANRLSVCLELQADFLAGVWAHHADEMKSMIESGDVDAALRAANAIGDDKLQKQAQGYVVPDSFTHGTSAQRIKWFKRGLASGDIRDGDTFSARDL